MPESVVHGLLVELVIFRIHNDGRVGAKASPVRATLQCCERESSVPGISRQFYLHVKGNVPVSPPHDPMVEVFQDVLQVFLTPVPGAQVHMLAVARLSKTCMIKFALLKVDLLLLAKDAYRCRPQCT